MIKGLFETHLYVSNLTKSIDANLASDNNGNPFVTYPEGIVGWTIDNDQEKMILNSEFDIWLVDLSNKTEPKSITNEKGAADKIRYRYPNIYNKNIFMDVIKMHIDEMKFCNELKIVCNAEIDARNKITSGDKSRGTAEKLNILYVNKNKKIDDILDYRKTRITCDSDVKAELYNDHHNESSWFFY